MSEDRVRKRIRRIAGRLPEDVKAIALKELASDGLHRLAAMNIESVSVRGKYGLIMQSIDDRIILPFYARTGTWAPEINARLVEFFAGKGGTYIDVGANIGLTTIAVAQNPNVDCITIEADPGNFAYLSANIAANCPHSNVTLHNVAAYNCTATVELERSPDNFGDHHIKGANSNGGTDNHRHKTIRVKAAPLDDLVKPTRFPLAIKIDTQGAEPFVIQGATHTLAQAKLAIIEFWPYGVHRMGGDIRQIIDLLKTFEAVEIPAALERVGPMTHFDAIASRP
jgi:FkbM family methyltransferase